MRRNSSEIEIVVLNYMQSYYPIMNIFQIYENFAYANIV